MENNKEITKKVEKNSHSIASTTMLVMWLTGLGFLLGFLAQIVIAKNFGVGAELDAFVVAAVVPEFIFGLSNVIFLTSLMILFPEYQRAHGVEAGKKYLQRMFTVVVLFAFIFTGFALLFSPWIAIIIAPGFSSAQLALTTMLIRVLSIAAFFFVLSSFTTAILYHEHKFIPAKLLRAIVSGSIIIAVIVIGQWMGVKSLAVGTILGIAFVFFIQYAAVKRLGFSFSPSYWEKSEVRKLFVFSLPLIITSLFFYVNKFIINIIASTTGTGSIAILNYSFILINVPVLFFSDSLVTSLFPHFTKNAANNEVESIRSRLVKAVYALLFIITPIMIFFMVFSQEIVYYLFERGAFTTDATRAVSDVIFIFAAGLMPLGLMTLVGSTFNAMKRVKERMYMFLFLLMINVLLSLFLVKFFSYKGIAVAISTGYWIVVIGGMWHLLNILKFCEYNKFFIELLKMVVASGVSAAVALLLHLKLVNDSSIVSNSLTHGFLLLCLTGILFGFYCLLMKTLKTKSWEIVMQTIVKKNGK